MAIDQGTETVTFTKTERTWHVEIFIEYGQDPQIRVYRETLALRPDGTVLERVRGPVVLRQLSQIKDEERDGVTGEQLAGFIAERADYWRQQDLEAEAAQQAEEAARQEAEEAARLAAEEAAKS